MIKVTRNEALEILKEIKGATYLNITQVTDPRLKKTGNPYIGTVKVSNLVVLTNSDYATRVLNQLAREGKDPRAYNKGTNTNPLTPVGGPIGENHKGDLYLWYTLTDGAYTRVRYLFNGSILNRELIAPFQPKKYSAKNQGTDKEILIRKVKFENIASFKLDGESYKIVD